MLFSRFQKQYHPLNTITLSKSALLHNYKYLLSLVPGMQLAPVLKSNAYGHGLSLMAKMIDDLQPPFICVDSLYEAYELLQNKLKTPILITGYVDPRNLSIKKLPFSYVVYDSTTMFAILQHQPHASFHIFIDTGMHREGMRVDDLPDFIALLKKNPSIRIDGIMSHFGESESPDKKETKSQVKTFRQAVELYKNAGFQPRWIHIANSSAILQHNAYKDLGNIARPGVALYGIDPKGTDKNLKPVLQLETKLNQVKIMKKGEKTGYGFSYTAEQDMTVGILPLGYNDGLNNHLSNTGFVKIGEVFCSIIGRVSMNLTTIDLSKVKEPYVGQNVIVFSRNPEDKNSVYNASIATGDTISYTLLTGLHTSTKRIVV